MSLPRDPGLQPERTALAWRRTGLAAGLVCLTLAFALVRLDLPFLAVAAIALAAATGFLAMRHFPSGNLPSGVLHAWPALVRISAIVVGVGVLGASAAIITAVI